MRETHKAIPLAAHFRDRQGGRDLRGLEGEFCVRKQRGGIYSCCKDWSRTDVGNGL